MASLRTGTSTSARRSSAPRTAALTAAACIALVVTTGSAARAQPITYTFTDPVSGTLQGREFSGALMTLTLTGADASVPNGSSVQHVYSGLTEYLTLTTGGTTVSGQVATDAYVFSGNQGSGEQFLTIGTSRSAQIYTDLGVMPVYTLQTPIVLYPALDGYVGNIDLPAAGLAITGLGFGATFTAAFDATVTPEPSTWALLGTGLLAVGGVAARRRRARG